MGHSIFGWDLPPGCRVSDIPGNRPEDSRWEAIYDGFWDKERLTSRVGGGIRITEEEYAKMDKIWRSNSKVNRAFVDLADNYIMAAIEYGMDIGGKEERAIEEENHYYETRFIGEALDQAKDIEDAKARIKKILGGNYETP